jgi:formate dehydrogenase major subunit
MASDGRVDRGNAGACALDEIDKALSERPNKIGHDFSAATRCLCAYRDELIGIWRASGAERDRLRLERTNAVLSMLLSGHFPLGAIPWDKVESARSQLADLLRSV